MNRLASRKLVLAAFAIAAVALNRKWGIGLTSEEIQAIVNIALAAIGSQAGLDLADRALPLFSRGTPRPKSPAKEADNS